VSDRRVHDGVISSACPDSLLGRLLRLFAPGFGWCGRCGRPWKFAREHSTALPGHGGCFPLCERCWKALRTPENRLPYYHILWLDWTEDCGVTWPMVYDAVMLEGAGSPEAGT